MLRASASRRVVGTGVAVVAAAGIGLGAYSLGSASGASTPQGSPVALEVPATPPPTGAKDAPATPSPAAPTTTGPLTLDQAKAVAVRAVPVPGRVVEWDTDQEPTGLRYDVTLLHADGSTTDVEVDAATGRVTGIDQHDPD
jgi:hypothetical protein